jgi:hypothetical protein
MLRVMHHLDAQPFLAARKRAGAFARWLYRDNLLRLLDRAEDPGRIANRLLPGLSAADPPLEGFARSIMLEYAGIADDLQRIFYFDEEARKYRVSREELDKVRRHYAPLRDVPEDYIVDLLMTADYAVTAGDVLAYYREVTRLAHLSFVERRDQFRQLHNELHWLENALLLGTIRPLNRDVEARTRLIAQQRAAHLLCAIWAYHEEHGRLPRSLDDLLLPRLETMRRDPFSSGDFRYAVSGTQFKLYTVGEDSVDQGGTHGWNWGFLEEADYVFWPVQTPPLDTAPEGPAAGAATPAPPTAAPATSAPVTSAPSEPVP